MKKGIAGLAIAVVMLAAQVAHAQSARMEGFTKLPGEAKVVLMPFDVELFSITAGGVQEPRADWTEMAQKNLGAAFGDRKSAANTTFTPIADDNDEGMDGLKHLHGAVGTSIVLHHLGILKLPTKEGKFDWSLGPDVAAIKQKTGADYALFVLVRDSYTSGERVAAMIVAAAFGVGLRGGQQVGYASLVDLNTGNVVWFNLLRRVSGDLREPERAKESLDALLRGFPDR